MLKSWMGLCRKAIVGGAQFIGQSYVKAGQNTLYKMRWNPENPGKHQYATGVTWASVNAQNMKISTIQFTNLVNISMFQLINNI